MGKQRRTRLFAAVKRTISKNDPRLKENVEKNEEQQKKKNEVRVVEKTPTALFFKYYYQIITHI